MTWSNVVGMKSQAVCDYAVGKVAGGLRAAHVVTAYGIICSVVQSIVPF